MTFVPILLVICASAVWTGISIYKGTFKYMKDEFVATLIILLFIAHPSLVKSQFSAFSCREIDPGEYWLVENLDIECWSGEHLFYALNFALAGIVVWGIGIPAICLHFLNLSSRRLDEISVRLKFGFLFNGYNYKHYYWEFVILYRKIIIICCSVFLANYLSVEVQALTVMIILLLSLHIQYSNQPYSHNDLN